MKPVPLTRINLHAATVLLVDPNSQSLSVLTQAFHGFGAQGTVRAETIAEAKDAARCRTLDLVVCEGAFHDGGEDGYDFVQWLRRSQLEPNAYAPVILTSAHVSHRNVARARECGANFIVAKPITPNILLDRILWVARENRPWVECDAYCGPDRRFKNEGPPAGMEGRRSTDLSGHVGRAKMPNMSQDEIDGLMMPKRAVI
jgi:CheY-like chemotaxis protein